MVVFPELMLPGYNSDRIGEVAQGSDGPWIAQVRDMARAAGCGICLGYAERRGPTGIDLDPQLRCVLDSIWPHR